jgi:3-oxoacyl-[acyl-carrier-protein] synthase-3
MMTERFARVRSTGSALPPGVIPNTYFEAIVDTSDEWIRDRTGIQSRRFVAGGETTASLGAEAAARALHAAGIDAQSIDFLIVATCTPDRIMPSSASYLERRLGMSCPAFDLNAACAGFVYALQAGASQIVSGAADRVLVVGSDVMSRILNLNDRKTSILFGDGAGAVVLEAGEDPGIFDSRLGLDPVGTELITVPAGGSETPATAQTAQTADTKLRMDDGQAVFRAAVVRMAASCGELLEKAGMASSDVDLVIAHQANARILASVGRRLGIAPERVLVDIADVGNTSAASIPIALDRAWRRGKLRPGHLVLTTAFGAGLAWGANLLRWTAPPPSGESDRWTG